MQLLQSLLIVGAHMLCTAIFSVCVYPHKGELDLFWVIAAWWSIICFFLFVDFTLNGKFSW